MSKIILDLCGGSGSWSKPYLDNGYDVRIIDIQYGTDVRLTLPLDNVHGILAAPPCTDLAGSGARWWIDKGESALLAALSICDACLRIVYVCKPVFWALENPVGRLRKYYGNPILVFNPYDYGDPWSKKTLLWGNFNIPKKNPVEPIKPNPIHYMGPGPERARLRSVTPSGFSQAFYEANP